MTTYFGVAGLGSHMDGVLTLLALVTGILTGAIFRFLSIPIPAPPNLAGVLGIVGLFVGYQIVDYLGVGIDLLARVGLG